MIRDSKTVIANCSFGEQESIIQRTEPKEDKNGYLRLSCDISQGTLMDTQSLQGRQLFIDFLQD